MRRLNTAYVYIDTLDLDSGCMLGIIIARLVGSIRDGGEGCFTSGGMAVKLLAALSDSLLPKRGDPPSAAP